MNGFPDAVIARSAAGPDPRKPDFPEVGVIKLVSVAGTERVIVTALDARGNLDPQEYYITLQDVVNLSGSGGALTSSSAEGITTVKPSLNTDNLQLQSPDKIILDVALISLVGGGTGPGADVSFLGADVTAGQHSAELDFITGNATGAGGITGPLYLGSGNSAADVSGLVSLGSGTAGTTSGEADLFSGDAQTTGPVNIQSGNASAGDSGNVLIQTGTATGTRGSIIIDAPSVLFSGAAGALLTAQTAPAYLNTAGQTGSTASQWAGIGSGDSVDGDGGGAEIYTGNTSGSGATGEVDLHSGDANGTGNTGGVHLYSGNASAGNSGNISLQTGSASGTRGNIVLNGPILKTGDGTFYTDGTVGFDMEVGNVDSTGAAGTAAKAVYIQAGIAVTLGQGGDAFIQAGDGGSTGGNGGLAGLQAGSATFAGATGGETHIVGGQAQAADAHGGAVLIVSGQGQGTGNSGDITIRTGTVAAGTRGNVIITGLPTADPHVVGAIWIDAAAGRAIKSSNG
jgi:hypothetical protein